MTGAPPPPAPNPLVHPHDAALAALLADARGDGRAFLAAAFDFAARNTDFFSAPDASRQLARLLRDVQAEHGSGSGGDGGSRPGSGLTGGFLGRGAAATAAAEPAAPLPAAAAGPSGSAPVAAAPPASDSGSDAAPDDPPASTGLAPNAGNGADFPTYSWIQTLSEVVVTVPVPAGTRGAGAAVSISKDRVEIGLKGQPPILAGALEAPVRPEDCFWSVVDGKAVEVTLTKADGMRWWAAVVTGEPALDVTKVEPENSKLGDLDAETRATVEKMMWDQRQRATGGLTSDQAAKAAAVEKFKAAHPELDFSSATIN